MRRLQRASRKWDFLQKICCESDLLQGVPAVVLCLFSIILPPTGSSTSRRGCISVQCHTSPLHYLLRLLSAYPLSTLVIINSCMIPGYETISHFRHKNQLREAPYVCRKSKHEKMLHINTYQSLWFPIYVGINWLCEIWELYRFTARTKSQLVPSAFTTKKAPWIRPFRIKKTCFWTFCRSWILRRRIVYILPVHLQCKRFLFKVRVLKH